MDHAGQQLSHLLLSNHIVCPSVKPTGATPYASRGKEASDVSYFGSQRLDLLSNLPDFCTNACQLSGTWCRRILIGHRLNWVRIGHDVLARGAAQKGGPPWE